MKKTGLAIIISAFHFLFLILIAYLLSGVVVESTPVLIQNSFEAEDFQTQEDVDGDTLYDERPYELIENIPSDNQTLTIRFSHLDKSTAIKNTEKEKIRKIQTWMNRAGYETEKDAIIINKDNEGNIINFVYQKWSFDADLKQAKKATNLSKREIEIFGKPTQEMVVKLP